MRKHRGFAPAKQRIDGSVSETFAGTAPMSKTDIAYLLAWIDLGCWGVCFWWMHCISVRQDRLLEDLHKQAAHIAQLSKVEHDLIKEVHPNVAEIKERVEAVTEAVNAAVENKPLGITDAQNRPS
jgi:hypothetical protein